MTSPDVPAAAPAQLPPRVWSPRRSTLHERIAARSDELGYLYWAAVEQLESPIPEGAGARHRLVMICHSVRELMHNAPDLFDDVEKPTRGRTGTNEAMDELGLAWDDDRSVLGDHGDHARFAKQKQDHFTVRGRLLAAAAKVVTTYRTGTRNNEIRQSATVLGRPGSRADPILREWIGTQRWFIKHAHVDSSVRGGDVPSDDDILQHLRFVEDVLHARLAPFFEVKDELDQLLSEANARAAGVEVSE